ncbi:MAG: hypothetical protein MI807_19830 [Verrucomicrobiales bacterium]|nr:hypothetical protein [Verrucomicrobiales bacterium]
MRFGSVFLSLAIASFFPASLQSADGKKTRDEMVIEDRDELQNSDTWIYNDLEKAKEAAAASGKPMMIVFRCIP